MELLLQVFLQNIFSRLLKTIIRFSDFFEVVKENKLNDGSKQAGKIGNSLSLKPIPIFANISP